VKRFELRPDLRTAGGEVNDILVDGRFAGTMALVWREGGRLTGAVQLDREAVRARDKREVLARINDYVRSVVMAADIDTCEVFVTYSPYEQLIVTADDAIEAAGEDAEPEWGEAEYELVLVGKRRNRLHYHVYDDRSRLLAEARLRAANGKVTGSVEWRREPDEDDIELVTELIVSDFDEDSVDEFLIDHRHDDELIETVELAYEEEQARKAGRGKKVGAAIKPGMRGEANFSARLIRDDGDALTYEIRSKADGNRTIGTATVDIRERRLTGFIDFRERRHADDAGAIAAVLMRELDKEKEYDGLNLSLMYRNKLIDEFVIENETVH